MGAGDDVTLSPARRPLRKVRPTETAEAVQSSSVVGVGHGRTLTNSSSLSAERSADAARYVSRPKQRNVVKVSAAAMPAKGEGAEESC